MDYGTIFAGLGVALLIFLALGLTAIITAIVAFSRGHLGWGFIILATLIGGSILSSVVEMHIFLVGAIMFSGMILYWFIGGNNKNKRKQYPKRRRK